MSRSTTTAAAFLISLALLAVPATAGAALFEIDGEFGSGVRPEGTFAQPAGIAIDNAGRVFVADSAAGRVEVFDSGEAGNGYLRTIGEGTFKNPVGVSVDLRNRVYVADSAQDTVFQYQPFIDDNVFFRQWGGSGTELGKMSNPRFIVPDRSGLVYNTERGNARVQWFRPEEGAMVPVSAFGTAEPPSFSDPEGIVRDDNSGDLYVADENLLDGEVRAYDQRGAMLGQLAGPGAGPGKLTAPRGLAIDPFGRVLVVDTGDGRLELFSPFSGGGGFVDGFGGEGQLGRPVAAVFGPGAYLYVTDEATGKVLRFRYDDEDKDSVLDERDNCRGLSNPDQSDVDRDRSGDACDSDDDSDGIPDEADACPLLRRGPDANGDGCADVQSQVTSPGGGVTLPRRSTLRRVAGTARGGKLARVQYAIARVSGKSCAWYAGPGRFTRGSCATPSWRRAKGTTRWSANVKISKRGRYRVISRALERGGDTSASSAPRTFRLR